MFHKRLLKEFAQNKILVVGMVVAQWITLLANVVLIYVLSGFIATLLQGEVTTKQILVLVLTFCLAFLIRAVMTICNQKMSFKASYNVKKRLREMTFQKLMQFGKQYHEAITTSEAVQISTEGVDQLEIYFGKYVPQFFYSLLAPVTLFMIVGIISMRVAIVLLICVPLIPVSIVAVQKFAKKMLASGTFS